MTDLSYRLICFFCLMFLALNLIFLKMLDTVFFFPYMIKCWLFRTFNHLEILFFIWVLENNLKLSTAANVYFIQGNLI